MKVRIKRIDKSLPLPIYETKGSVGFDLVCREDTKIPSGEVVLIPGNVVVDTPEGYMLMLTLRSSTPRKKGLLKPHGVGIVDTDYCGNDDELKVQVFNFTKDEVEVKRGEKIAQGIFVRVDKHDWEETDDMAVESRGGFGSTDNKEVSK